MHQLHSASGPQNALVLEPKRTGAFDHKKRTQPLAAAKRGVSHRFEQSCRSANLPGQGFLLKERLKHRLKLCRGSGQETIDFFRSHATPFTFHASLFYVLAAFGRKSDDGADG
jgi:hypothetical protein